MDAYKVQQTVKNGQLIIDLPAEFDDSLVEVIVLQVAQKAESNEISKIHKPYEADLETGQVVEEPAALPYGMIPPRKKIKASELYGTLSDEAAERWEESIEDSYESDFWLPRPNIDLKQFRGALKHDITTDEIDSLTKNWRGEWNRDFL
jgi:hypothetical protein